MLRTLFFLLITTAACPGLLPAQECRDGLYDKVTDDFSFIASSAAGAVGDVVAVDIAVKVDSLIADHRLFAVHFAVCYDGNVLELIENIGYTPEFYELFWFTRFYPPSQTVAVAGTAAGLLAFHDGGNVSTEVANKVFASADPLPVMTVFFRIKAKHAGTTSVRFCDSEFHLFRACNEIR